MTHEEAIKYAEEKLSKGLYRLDLGYLNRGLYQIVAKEVDFMRAAISALREQPVVHGRWESHYEHDFVSDEDVLCGLHCSLCGLYYVKRHNYCPNCGARMDGGGND